MATTDANYSDYLRALNQYGSTYNYGSPTSYVNPYGGQAYLPYNYREIRQRMPGPVDARSAYRDPETGDWRKLSAVERLAPASMGYTLGSKGAPVISQAAQSIGGFSANPAIAKMGGLGLGAAGALYGLTRDQNPYVQTTGEQIGNVASPSLALASTLPMLAPKFAAAGPLGAVLGLGLGIFLNEKQRKKTLEANIKAEEEFLEKRGEHEEKLAGIAKESREEFMAQTESDLWAQEASKYSNQYGAYTNPYGTTYMKKGGKLKYDNGGVLPQTQSMPLDSLFNRQLYTESEFEPDAESPRGAIGLSQITQDTFNDMIGWGWVPEGKKFSDLKTDTDLSVDLQERFMTDLMTRDWNKGTDEVKIAKALAAYNMGPTGLVNKLNELKAEGKDIYSNLDWVDNLTGETKNYVNKIMKGGGEKFEREYTQAWQSRGSNYDKGGKMNVVAEFTGNELIVNDQNEVEAGLATNDFTRAAAPIKRAMNEGFVTPGVETHKGNPMSVDNLGNIYAGGGPLSFKVEKGAGIYDHATDQFKNNMTDKQIAMVAKKNIVKWKKNNMA